MTIQKGAAAAAAEEEAPDDIAADRIRFNEQVALMLNVNYLIKERNKIQNGGEWYSNFVKFKGQTGGHIGLTNNVFRSDATQYLFKKIPSSVLSSLLPSLKFYKVFFPSPIGKKGYSWRIPFDDISVPSPDDKNASRFQEKTLSELLDGTGRMHGIGIKSFSYKYVGTNPAEVNTNIEAELQIFFQDIRDFIERKPINHKVEFLETPTEIPEGGFDFAYSDLVIDNPKNNPRKANGSLEYNSRYFRLKVESGYMLPSSDILDSIENETDRQNVVEAIKTANVVLYLTPFSHDISFEENGSATLTIKYIAASTGIISSIDALGISEQHAKVKQLEEEFEKAAFVQKQEIENIKKNCSISESERQKKVEEKDKQIQSQLYEEKTKLENDRNDLYREIFRVFVGQSTAYDTDPQPSIFSANFNSFAVGAKEGDTAVRKNPNQIRIKELKKAKEVKNFKKLRPEEVGEEDTLELAKPAEGPSDWAEVGNIVAQDLRLNGVISKGKSAIRSVKEFFGSNPSETEFKEAINKIPSAVKDTEREEFVKQEDGTYIIKFIFLGDLINTVLGQKSIQALPDDERPRFIFNDFQIEVPKEPAGELKDKSLKDLSDVFNTDAEYEIVTLNIADIPISVYMLQNFFVEKIAKSRRTTYPLTAFLNDIMTDIVIPSVSPSVFGRKTVLNKAIRLSSLLFTIPFIPLPNGRLADPIILNDSQVKFGGRARNSQGQISGANLTEEIVKRNRNKYRNYIAGNTANYYVMYCSNQLPSKILQNNLVNNDFASFYNKNQANGVYHFFVGSDTGLIKRISFSKQDAPFNKEARAFSSTGDKTLGRLVEVYDANITMFGNNLFRPGDFIYIEPLFFTRNAAVDLQNKIGLGGFYQVIDVSTSVNENIFETVLNTTLAGRLNSSGKVEESSNKVGGGC